MACLHCYIPNERKRRNDYLTISNISTIGNKIFASADCHLEIIWHGGEPTLLGKDYLANAVSILNELALQNKTSIRHSLQTNLCLIDASWCNVLKDCFGSKVGTSFDPDIRNLNNKAWAENIKMLRNNDIHVSVNITVTKPLALKGADNLMSLLKQIGCREYHLERFTPRGQGANHCKEYYLNDKEFYVFMKNVAEEYKNVSDLFFLSPFSGIKNEIPKQEGFGCWQGKCLSDILTINPDGSVSSCPDLAVEDKYIFGNIFSDSIQDILESPKRVKMIVFQRANICDCKYVNICNGGCPLHKMLWKKLNPQKIESCCDFFTFLEKVEYA